MKPTEPKPTQLTQTLTLLSGAGVKPQGRELEKQIVDKILGEGYDKRIRPSGINNKTGQNGKRATLEGRIQVQIIAHSLTCIGFSMYLMLFPQACGRNPLARRLGLSFNSIPFSLNQI